jgi:cytochrome d ubiquinol oxidase subunit II
MQLNTVWFVLIAVLFTGFFFLEGFDYGVGILLPFLGKNDNERRMIINSIGPVWDGNEVWMVTAGGAMFASFPDAYATLFSGFYLALVIMLVALIFRGVAFEYRGKRESKKWRAGWDWAIFAGSLIPALLWGVVIANLMRGFAIEMDMNYYGGLLPLLYPYTLLGGLFLVSLFSMHGANFLTRKVTGNVVPRAQKASFIAWISTIVLAVIFLAWTYASTDILSKPGINGMLPAILATLCLLFSGWLIRSGRSGWAFIAGSLAIVFTTLMVFAGLYPRILISSLDPAWSLTIVNAASSHYTLQVMTIVAAIFIPVILIYQGWTYWVFRKRVDPKSEKLIY